MSNIQQVATVSINLTKLKENKDKLFRAKNGNIYATLDVVQLDAEQTKKFDNGDTADERMVQNLLNQFVEIMETEIETEPFKWPEKERKNDGAGSGYCEKHGKFYSVCHSCQKDKEKHEQRQQTMKQLKLKEKLNKLKREVKQTIE